MTPFHKILVLSAHTDDAELGCGASIAKWIKQGKEILYIAFSAAEESVPKEFPNDTLRKEVMESTSKLGIAYDHVRILNYRVRRFPEFRQNVLNDLIQVKEEFQPDLVLIPSKQDIHQDHQVVTMEGVRAFKFNTILSYELPWNCLEFHNVCYSRLDEEHVMKKLEALKCYVTQAHRAYFNKDFIYGLAVTRGVQSNTAFAECFEVIRWML